MLLPLNYRVENVIFIKNYLYVIKVGAFAICYYVIISSFYFPPGFI